MAIILAPALWSGRADGQLDGQVQTLQNHVRPAVSNHSAAFVSTLPPGQQLHLSLQLPLRNQAALAALLQRLYDPTSPDFRHFLTEQQFADQFGPTQQDYDAVRAFAVAHGLQLGDAPANRVLVPVTGSVARINAAFSVQMSVYQHPTENRTFYSPDREPSLSLGVAIAHIHGLDDYSLPRPHVVRRDSSVQPQVSVTGSGPGGSYLGSDMRAAYYGGTALDGTGQSVGVLEFSGYDINDVNLTFSNAGQTNNVPVNNVFIDNATLAFTAGNAEAEVVLDIVQAIGMAPGLSQVRVYVGNQTTPPIDILNSMVSENLAKQLSCSWGWVPNDIPSEEAVLQEMAAQGQSFFTASGDDGAYDLAVSRYVFPSEDPYVISVGGTHLTTNGAGGSWTGEIVWNSSGGGSGGGISPDNLPIPSWQAGVANSANGGSTTLRNAPDVAMEADFDNYNCTSGKCAGDWAGTSFATPRWAGFMALVNQQAVEAGNAPSGGIGFINPQLYQLAQGSNAAADFHDITSGNNLTDNQPIWFSAVPGYDLTTGWGSANGQSLINDLAGQQAPGFWLETSKSTVAVNPGGSNTATLNITDAGGFTGNVTLAITSTLPAGVNAVIATNPATTSSLITFTVDPSAASQSVVVTVTGTSGSLTQTVSFTLVIHTPSFALSASPSSVSMAAAATATSTVTVQPLYNFTGNVALSVSGLPSGITASFSPTSTSGTSTLTFTGDGSGLGGTTPVTVTGTSGGITATTTIALILQAPSFQLSAASTTIGQGSSGSSYVYISALYGFTGSVTLAASNLPAGVTASFSPNPTSGGSSYSYLTLNVSSSAAVGTNTITITGTSGAITSTTTATLTVVAPTFTLSNSAAISMGQNSTTGNYVYAYPEYGFTGPVTLSLSGLPSGVTALITPNPITVIGYEGSGEIYLTTSANATPGQYPITITGTSGSQRVTSTLTLTVSAPTFYINSGSSLQIGQGSSSSTYAYIEAEYGFTGNVTLAISGMPAGVTASFTPNPTAYYTTLNVQVGSAVPVGTYPLTITGTSGSQTVTTQFTLSVYAPSFTLSSSYGASIGQGSSGTAYAYVYGQYGFNSPVTFSLSALPTGVTATISPNPTTYSSTITFQAAANAAVGNYPITVTGTSGSQTVTTSLTLTVFAPTFTISGSYSISIGQGASATGYVYVSDQYGFTTPVTLSASGLPTGMTATFATNPTTVYSNAINFSVSSSTPAGQYPITISGTANGQTMTTTLTIAVVAPGFTVSAGTTTVAQGGTGTMYVYAEDQGGFSSPVTFSLANLPAGVTASFSPNPTSYSSNLSFSVSSAAAVGTYPITITGTSGGTTATAAAQLSVVAPSFTVYGSTVTLNQGGSATTSINVYPNYGITGAVTLSLSGLPSGVTGAFSINPVTSNTVLTLTAASTAAAGTTTFTITGTYNGATVATATSTVTVNAGSFTLADAPSEIELHPGNSGKSTIAIAPVNGFTGNVAFTVSGLPAGVTASFTPATATTASTLLVTASNNASPGSSTLTITGTSGSLAATTTVTLNLLSAQTATATTLALTANGAGVSTVAPATLITGTAAVSAGATALTAGQVYLCDAAATYCDSVHQLATAQLTSAGTATFRFIPGIGARNYKAMFAGNTTYSASASTNSPLTVRGALASSTAVTLSGTPGSYTLTATVTGQGDISPTGTVAFDDTSSANQPVATAPLTLSSATPALSLSQSISLQYTNSPNKSYVADFNGDGIPDLAIATGGYAGSSVSLTIYLGNGNGTFTAGATLAATSPQILALGDFNHDGHVDIVTPGANDTLSIYLGNGDGTFTLSPSQPFTGAAVTALAVADFNGDGYQDIAALNPSNNSLILLLGNGDGTFTISNYSPSVTGTTALIAADFDNDGIPDLAVINGNYSAATFTILLGNGDGTFTALPAATAVTYTAGAAVTDFNGDGVADLLITSSQAPPQVYLGNGDGTFAAGQSAGNITLFTTAVADFNNDGKPDIVGIDNGYTAHLLTANGDGTFANAVTYKLPNSLGYLSAGDWNQDGIPDVVATANGTFIITVLTTGLTQTATATATGISPVGSGTHLVDAVYPGDTSYQPSASTTVGLTGSIAAPTVTVTPAAQTGRVTQSLAVGIAVGDGTYNAIPTGTVTLSSGSYTSAAIALVNGAATITIPAGSLAAGTDTLSVTYTPDSGSTARYTTATGSATASLTLTTPTVTATPTSSSINSSASVNVTVTVADPDSYSTPTGSIVLSGGGFTSASVALVNGSATITIPGSSLAPGSDTLTATYTPDTPAAALYATASNTTSITVSQTSSPVTWATPASITYGTALSAMQLNATSTIPGTFVYTPAAGAVLGAGTQTLSVTFTPTDTITYSTTTTTVMLTVAKAYAVITWPTPAAITYGTPLSATQLNATANIPGTFIYAPSLGTVVSADQFSPLQVLFSPTDSANYNRTSASVFLVINKATPSIVWPTPAPIPYGTALSAAQLNATSTTPGTFTYTPALGTVPTVGTQTLSVTFTPTDGIDYNTATSTVSLSVGKTTPSITWGTPAPITYGTALSAAQLNATSTIPGTFAYTPALGTIPTAGTQALSVTFTPTDTTDYATTTATVSLTVTKATPSITWAAPASISYGTSLSATQLNATSAIPGTFTYSPALGTIPTAGTQTLSVTFTPTDTTDYSTTTDTVTLTVTKATPSITWPAPAAVPYGTALSIGQLNATSATPGAFSYSPTLGTIPTAGTQTLSVTFTPTDTTNYSSSTASVMLTVTKAAPAIVWPTPTSISYGMALTSAQLNATSATPGTFTYTPALGTVPTAGTQTLSVLFTPTDTTDYSTTTASVTLTVTKTSPVVVWPTPASIPYGTALSATQLNATSTTPGAFSYSPTLGTIPTAGTQTLSVTFTPTDTTNYSSSTASVMLTVTKAAPAIVWPTPTSISYGMALTSAQLNATSATPGTFTYSPALGTIPAAGTQTLSVTFTPTDTTDYSTTTATVTLTVTRTTPSIIWTAPASIPYGTALSSTQLNASSTIPGTFTYTPALGAVPAAGTQTLSVTFTPNDSTDYSTTTSTVSLTVTKSSPVVVWPTPASIPYGTALTSSQLNATSTTPGTFTYTPALGTIPTAGTQTLSVTFTPTDTTDYSTNTATVTLTVTKITPSIIWTAPASIPYGTALSATQLNATSTTPGTFSYSPALGTIPTAGTQTLSVTFTPTDTADYSTTTATVTLTIAKATLTLTANSAARTYGTANPTFTGTLSGALNGDTFTETFSSPANTSSPAGTYPIIPTATGSNSANYQLAATNGTLTINPASTATTLTLSNQNLTLTASVASSTTGTPTGSIGFYSGSALLGSGTLSGGIATFTLTTFPATNVQLYAQYAGDANFTASTSTPTSVLALSAGSSSLSVSTAGTATDALTLAVPSGYSGTIQLSCSGLPTNAACSFSPSSVPFTGTATTAAVTLTVGTGGLAALDPPAHGGANLAEIRWAGLFTLPSLFVLCIRRRRSLHGSLCLFTLLLLLVAAGAELSGCGGNGAGSFSSPTMSTTTPAGTYAIQVVATAPSGASQTAAITLTVQ